VHGFGGAAESSGERIGLAAGSRFSPGVRSTRRLIRGRTAGNLVRTAKARREKAH